MASALGQIQAQTRQRAGTPGPRRQPGDLDDGGAGRQRVIGAVAPA